MIVSNDTIKMKPPYTINQKIIQLIASISEQIGEVNARYLVKQDPKLRKQNRIKTIHSSLAIEGNTLSEEQITALIENKKVVGPKKDIKEVLNAIEVYSKLKELKFKKEKDFLTAHKLLMHDLVDRAGQYRNKGVGITMGKKIAHIAPPYKNVPSLMKELFTYLKDKEEPALIMSCVFHYELEFIHPFMDGNGRMGRLWQTLILMNTYPVFEFLPFETLISKNQKEYYKVLSLCDKAGNSTQFIVYILSIIQASLGELQATSSKKLNDSNRMEIFLEEINGDFTRKDYLKKFPQLSTATASRDLKMAITAKLIKKEGDKKTTIYRKID